MVKKIRFKFVIITMSLLTSVFSALLLINFFGGIYLYRQDMIQLLDFITDSKSFQQNVFFEEGEYLSEIFAADFDQDGKLLKIISNLQSDVKSNRIRHIAERLYRREDKVGKYKSYVYVMKEDEDGTCFLAFVNLNSRPYQLKKVTATVALIIAAFILLLWVSIFLSRFVTDPAQKALEREKQFISDASHELKTPISAIILNAQAMSGTIKRNKYMDNILSEAERMNRLIRRLLTLAHADESEACIEKSKFSLSESCEEIVLPFESAAYENQISFAYDISENISYVGNCEDIKQVIAILLDNAFKYTPQGGKIIVKLRVKGSRPVLTVFNTGEGIPPEALPHIFDRFYRCEKSRSAGSGSFGLGLAIAKAIMTAHNGSIKAESRYGSHAIFTVMF